MELLDQYFELQKKIHEHFGYEEDWVSIPMDDATEYYWRCDGNEVNFAKTEQELETGSGDCYSNSVYKQRFLPKWIYETKDFTMICVDTHTDGNKFLQVFDNSKRRELSN